MSQENVFQVDAYNPRQMAHRVSEVGVAKAQLDVLSMFSLAVLAGAFIALGAQFATLAWTDNGLPFSLSKLLGGLTFCLGLILVIVAGAELFTGNNLIVMAWVSGKLPFTAVLRNWTVVYVGNLVGSVMTVVLIYLSRVWEANDMAVAQTAVKIAQAKVAIPFIPCLFRGIMCNALVCLAVWLCFSCRGTVDKIFAIVFPITAFVAMGFEHCVANMFFIPMGMLLARTPEVSGHIQATLDMSGFLHNLVPATIGNIIGGSLMVGVIYWFIYMRKLMPFAGVLTQRELDNASKKED